MGRKKNDSDDEKVGKKRRSDGDGGIWFETSTGRWRGSVTIGAYPNGRPRLHRVSGKTKGDVANKIREKRGELAAGTLSNVRNPNVRQWFEFWMPNIAVPNLRESTERSYDTQIRNWIIPHLGRYRLDKLRPEHIYMMIAAMKKAPPARKGGNTGRAASTIILVLTILEHGLNDAIRLEKIGRNVCDMVDRPSLSDMPALYLSVPNAKKVLTYVRHLRLAARWAVALVCGTRQGETLGLAFKITFLDTGEVWSAFDDKAARLHVHWELQRSYAKHGCGDADPETGLRPCGRKRAGNCLQKIRGGLVLVRPKSRKSRRTLGLDPIMVAELKHRRALAARERLQEGDRWKPWTTTAEGRPVEVVLMFGQLSGLPIDAARDSRVWHRVVTEAGAPDLPLHGARHSAASIMMDRGVDLKTVSETLGHSGTRITGDLYAHLEEQATRKAIGDAAGAMFKEAREDIEEPDAEEERDIGETG